MTDDVEGRVSTLEATVKREAWARAKMDEDLGDLKVQFGSQGRLLKALSKTQSEHTATLRDHTGRLIRIEDRLDRVERGLVAVDVGIRTIIDKIDRLEDGGSRLGPAEAEA